MGTNMVSFEDVRDKLREDMKGMQDLKEKMPTKEKSGMPKPNFLGN